MASPAYPIADMHTFPLSAETGSLTLLRSSDHLLRRFGQLELLDLAANETKNLTIRSEADRFLFAISGQVELTLLDLRETSPSRAARVQLSLSARQPQGVLVPFGVACRLVAASAARLIILSTHSEAHPADRAITADELAKFTGVQ